MSERSIVMDDTSEKLLELMRELLAEVKLLREQAAQARAIAEAAALNSAKTARLIERFCHDGFPVKRD